MISDGFGDSRAKGFTVIELMVAILVISVLMGLLIPAVQSARETGRRLSCTNNLKQIGLALHQYASSHGMFPAIYSDEFGPDNTGRYRFYATYAYSPLARMLPELGYTPLYNTVNLTLGHANPWSIISNQTAGNTLVSTFLCPSDSLPPVNGSGFVNYRFSIGPNAFISPGNTNPVEKSGAFCMHEFFRLADFPDGLSNTIGASERLQGDWTRGPFKFGGDYILGNLGPGTINGGNWEPLIPRCLALASTAPAESKGGASWFYSGLHFTNYNHCRPPNPPIPDCSFDAAQNDLHGWTLHSGVFSATSHHPAGVNGLHMDGSVHFHKNSLSLPVWMAISTRNGGEVLTIPST